MAKKRYDKYVDQRPADPPEPDPSVEEEAPKAIVGTLPGTPRNQASKNVRGGKIGRPPSFVREASRHGFYTRIPLLKKIADGSIDMALDVATQKGDVVTLRIEPSFAERLRAIDLLGKYGGLTSTAILDRDGEEQDLPSVPGYDFNSLETHELELLQSLLEKAREREDAEVPEARRLAAG